MTELIIGFKRSDYISLSVQEKGEKSNFASEPWWKTLTDFSISGWHGNFVCYLQLTDIQKFHQDLVTLNQTLKGQAKIFNLEDQLDITLEGDGKGRITVSGRFVDGSYKNTLEYTFETDQTCLADLLENIQEILNRYAN